MKLDLSSVADLTKRQRVELLLDHWQDFHETLHAVDHDHLGGGDPDAVTGMPAIYHHPSVVELRRVIGEARRVMPVNVAHMLAFYEAEWRTVDRVETRRTKKGRLQVSVRRRERIVPAWVRRRKVDHAVTLVAGAFRGPVHVPSELLEPIVKAAA